MDRPIEFSPRCAAGPRRQGYLFVAILVLCALLYGLTLRDSASWEHFLAQRDDLAGLVAEYPVLGRVLFFVVFVVVAALALPITPMLTVTGGCLFGGWQALVLVSFASTSGASLAFLLSRHLLRGFVERRWGPQLAVIQQGIARDGAFYLLTLRLSPLVPFSLVNVALGLTRMPLRTFWWVSQLAMLPVTFLFASTGAALGQVQAPADILAPPLVLALSLLAFVPLALRLAWHWGRRHWLAGKVTVLPTLPLSQPGAPDRLGENDAPG